MPKAATRPIKDPKMQSQASQPPSGYVTSSRSANDEISSSEEVPRTPSFCGFPRAGASTERVRALRHLDKVSAGGIVNSAAG
jgi:hypothetical protein